MLPSGSHSAESHCSLSAALRLRIQSFRVHNSPLGVESSLDIGFLGFRTLAHLHHASEPLTIVGKSSAARCRPPLRSHLWWWTEAMPPCEEGWPGAT